MLLLPTLVPAWVMADAPLEAVLPLMTMAPMGSPATQPARSHGRVAGKEVAGAREADPSSVEQRRGEHMLLLHAGHLFAQALVDEAEGVLRGRVGGAVVDGVDGEEQILAARGCRRSAWCRSLRGCAAADG